MGESRCHTDHGLYQGLYNLFYYFRFKLELSRLFGRQLYAALRWVYTERYRDRERGLRRWSK